MPKPLHPPLCPVCAGQRVHYAFSNNQVRVLQCAECRFTYRTVPLELAANAKAELDALVQRIGSVAALVRQVLPPATDPAAPICVVDWTKAGRELFHNLPVDNPRSPNCEAAEPIATLSVGQLDAFTDPLQSLTALRAQCPGKQPVIFVYSDIRRTGAETGTRRWEALLGERNAYLDTETALTVLFRAGFRCLSVRRLRRRVPLEHFLVSDANNLVSSPWRRRMLRLIPAPLRRSIHVQSRTADIAIVALPRPTSEPLVSVVVPVFNEARTVAAVLDAVLRVEVRGASVEIIVVESNSTDGSREIVQRYATHPRVRCLFEERPRGKGHATRFGLAHAQGDVLLIQDADLEYDIEDYHALIDPIVSGHAAFMLGSRHGGRNHWKLRQFQPFLAEFYNTAHVLVTAYINVLFGLRLRDPQTMFKVCRRDCIEGVSFHANYFNFDYELLLKIVRRGYRPVEVPVNYRSRSHAEGKKIRMWRDAPLGLWMITQLRLTPLRRFLSQGEPIE